MKRKTHKGQFIDMETLSQTNEKAIAMGNMGVNAKGDKIGPGGQVIQTSQQRTRSHYNTPKKTSKNVSIKEKVTDETLFPEEKKTKSQKESALESPGKAPGGPSKNRTKKKKVEKETESGDIIMVDGEEDET